MSQPVQPPDSHSDPSKHDISPMSRRVVWIIGSTIAVVIIGVVLALQDRAPQFSQDIEYSPEPEFPQDTENSTQPRTFDIPLYGEGGAGFTKTNYSSIDGVDMSRLNEKQKNKVMLTANSERCTCGCRMTLAQCITTDSTCPLRSKNLDRAQELISSALRGL